MGYLVTKPFEIFLDTDGTPLENGYLYFGTVSQNPETNPISIYWDADLTIPAANPVRTVNGYAARNGTPANLYTASNYSITVKDSTGRLVYNSPLQQVLASSVTQQVNDISTLRSINPSSGRVVYVKRYTDPLDGGGGNFESLTGATPGTYTDDNGITIVPTGGDGSSCWRRVLTSNAINPCMFGAQGDWNGATGTDDTAAIQACFNYVGYLKYKINTVSYQPLADAYVEFTPKASFYKVSGNITIPAGITIKGNGAYIQLVAAVVIDELFTTDIINRTDYYDVQGPSIYDLHIDCNFDANVGMHMIRSVYGNIQRLEMMNCMQNIVKMSTCQFNNFTDCALHNAPVPLLLQNNQWEVTAGYYVNAFPSLENSFTRCHIGVASFGATTLDWVTSPASYAILASIHLDKTGDNTFTGCSFGNVKNYGGVASNDPSVLTYIRAGVLSYAKTGGGGGTNKFIGCKDESSYVSFMMLDPSATVASAKHQIEITNHTFIPGIGGGGAETTSLAAVVSKVGDVKITSPFIYHLAAASAYIADSFALTSPFKYFYSTARMNVINPTSSDTVTYVDGAYIENYEHGEVMNSQSTRIGSSRSLLICREGNTYNTYGTTFDNLYSGANLTPLGGYQLFFESAQKPRFKVNTAAPASATDGNLIMVALEGSQSIDPANIAAGAGLTLASTITVTGAALGDFAIVSAPYDLQGIQATAYVSAANTVTIRLENNTAGAIDLASGTWRARVFKQ